MAAKRFENGPKWPFSNACRVGSGVVRRTRPRVAEWRLRTKGNDVRKVFGGIHRRGGFPRFPEFQILELTRERLNGIRVAVGHSRLSAQQVVQSHDSEQLAVRRIGQYRDAGSVFDQPGLQQAHAVRGA